MRVSGLDNNGDWRFGFGQSNYKTKSDAIAQKVKTRLLLQRREWFLNTDVNIDWFNLLGRKGSGVGQKIKNEIVRVVSETTGVARVDSVVVNLDPNNRKAVYSVSFRDIYNQIQSLEDSL
jgi:hypothetical protein